VPPPIRREARTLCRILRQRRIAACPHSGFEAGFERQWRQVTFDEALDEVRLEVDPATFQAFDLYARKSRPAGEVARLLGLSRNAVYQAKTRVLARVREKIGLSDDT